MASAMLKIFPSCYRLFWNPHFFGAKIAVYTCISYSTQKGMSVKFARRLFGGRFIAIACALVLLPFAAYAQNSGRQFLQGHVQPAVARLHLQPLGRLSATKQLNLAIGLPLRNQQALDSLLQQIYDPASPNYRHYLTPEQFTEQFGPTEKDYQAVINFAQANGLMVTETYSNRTLVDVSGSVTDIEKTFHVGMKVYQHPTEARTFYAPDVEPSLDLAVPVLHISGLDNFIVPRPMSLKATPLNDLTKVTSASGSGPSGLYMGNDFRAAYAPGVSLNGAGQVVGLLELDGYYTNDIANYESQAGLPNVTLTNVLVDSFSGNAGSNNVEVALDIEMAIAMAPGLSKVIVYEGPNPGLPVHILAQMASDNLAKQISSSWLMGDDPNYDVVYKEFMAQGQSFFQASGDDGAYYSGISQWADDTNITLVGGTTLTMNGTGNSYASETVWNWYITNPPHTNSSGGGISVNYPIPSWQQGIDMTTNHGSTTMRNVPDVALTADNILVRADNGTNYSVGGTSAAAPLWAGFAALVNQQAVAAGSSTVGFVNPAIYAIGKSEDYTYDFHDITTGNNTNRTSRTNFFAVPGYDLCTGWGTPTGSNLINTLTTSVLPGQMEVTPTSIDFGPLAIGLTTKTQPFSVINTGAGMLFGTASVTGPFAISSGSPYAVTPGATGVVNVSFSPVSPGSFTNTVVFSSNGGTASNTVTGVELMVGVRPASLDFGLILTNTTVQASFVITNAGAGTLTGTAVVGGAPFAVVSGNSFTVPGFGSTTVVISFTPTSVGAFSDNVIFTTSAGNFTCPVTGTGGGMALGAALGTATLLVSPAAGSNSVVLTVTPQTSFWTATTNAAWLHLSPANQSGRGSTNVVFSYDANPGATRSGTLTIAGQTLTVTQAGSTYIAAGAVTTLVSSGVGSPEGVAVDGAGNVYIADEYTAAIYEWTAANNTLTTLVSSGLYSPSGVAVDTAGNVYIADTANGAIKEWTAANSNVTTLVSSGLYDPFGVAVDGADNVYIADTDNGAIKEWTAANSNVTTLVSSGLYVPMGVAVDVAGNVYIGDTHNNAIKKWTAANSTVTTLASVYLPASVAVDGSGNVYIADTGYLGSVITKWTAANSTVTTLVSSGLYNPYGVAVDGSGNVYIADTYNDAIKELPYAFVDPTARFESMAAGSDSLPVVLPVTENLLAPFAPTSDQSWLTISGVTNGVVSFSFTATTSERTAHITVLGQTIPVTQKLNPGITPANGFNATGPVGGPFNVTSQSFSLTNIGGASLDWSLINTSSWLNASPSSGILAASGQTTVTVSLSPAVTGLAAGTYTASLFFTNQTTGVMQSRQFNLLIGQMLQNGGFETGDFSYWTLSGDTNTTFVYGGLKHSGSYGALLRTPDSLGYGYLSQTVLTLPGQNYLLSLWLDSPSNPGSGHPTTPNEFLVVWNGTTLFDQVNIPVIGWTNLQFIVTATASSTVLQFGFLDNPWHLGLDDVSLWFWPIVAPSFQSITQSTNTVWLNWTALPGLPYQMQYKTNLLQGSWINLGSIVTATNTTMTIPDVIGTDPQRYYRIQWVPTY
jgi:subtilase family serine protease